MLEDQPPLRVDVLGPLRLVVDGAEVDVPGPKRRALLALLALAEGHVVTTAELVDQLWPDAAPDSGRQALHSHVFRLRSHLGAYGDRLGTGPDGYRLRLDGFDLAKARSRLREARATLEADPAGTYALLGTAESLWRGPVLTDLLDFETVANAALAADRLLRDVRSARVNAAVRSGKAAEVLDLARTAAADDPLDEPAVLLLVRVLAASGRTPEALAVARTFRERLVEETGLDPSPALDDLVRAVARNEVPGAQVVTGDAPEPPRDAVGPGPRAAAGPGASLARIVGRASDVAALHRALAAERLVTVTGPGEWGRPVWRSRWRGAPRTWWSSGSPRSRWRAGSCLRWPWASAWRASRATSWTPVPGRSPKDPRCSWSTTASTSWHRSPRRSRCCSAPARG